MELLVCNKIMSLDLPVRDVYRKVNFKILLHLPLNATHQNFCVRSSWLKTTKRNQWGSSTACEACWEMPRKNSSNVSTINISVRLTTRRLTNWQTSWENVADWMFFSSAWAASGTFKARAVHFLVPWSNSSPSVRKCWRIALFWSPPSWTPSRDFLALLNCAFR